MSNSTGGSASSRWSSASDRPRRSSRPRCCTGSPLWPSWASGLGAGLGLAYFAAVAAAAVFIAYEHQLVRPGDLSRLDAAFFTMNGIVSIVVFLGALVDRVL